MIVIEAEKSVEDDIIELLIDFDVEDIQSEDGNIMVTTSPDSHNTISNILTGKNYTLVKNEITYIPQTYVTLNEKHAGKCLKMVETLEDLDDSQNVYSNFDISDDILMKISEEQ